MDKGNIWTWGRRLLGFAVLVLTAATSKAPEMFIFAAVLMI